VLPSIHYGLQVTVPLDWDTIILWN